MRWRDLVLPEKTVQPQVGWWTIPGDHTKNGEPHRVPLTEDAVTLVKAQIPQKESERGEFVFRAAEARRCSTGQKRHPLQSLAYSK
jgi:integrase